MAFSNGLGDRPEDRRFRNPQSPREESTFPSFTSPIRSIASQMQAHTSTANDARASLTRRFTTNTVPTLSPLSPIGQQRRQAAENTEVTSATYHKVQLLEKKKAEYEYLKEQRRRFEAEMELYDIQMRGLQNDFSRLEQDVTRNNYAGHQSEPTTPPEYRDQGFPSAFSRPQRYSMQGLTSPQHSFQSSSTRPSRSGSQIASPGQNFTHGVSHMPSKSMPGSRRGSDEDEDGHEFDIANMNPRSGAAALNRNSVPVTSLDLRNRPTTELPDLTSVLGHIDTTQFLFGDDDEKPRNPAASPDVKSYLQMNATDDKFPILVRRDGEGAMQLSAASAALDLASVSSHSPDPQSNGWPTTSRHRHAQHSLPVNNLHKSDDFGLDGSGANGTETPRRATMSNRHSMEVRFSPYGDSKRPGLLSTPPNGSTNGMPKLQSSYSTNDIPTMKSTNGLNGASTGGNTGVNSHAEQHLHNHNASMGRIPMNVVNRHSRELSGGDNRLDEPKGTAAFRSMGSALQANAVPFGPALNNGTTEVASSGVPSTAGVSSPPASTIASSNGTSITSPSMYGNPTAPYYGGYGVSMINMGMQGLSLNGQAPFNQMPSVYPPFNAYGQTYQQPYMPQPQPQPRFPDSQARVIQQRRMQSQEEHMRTTTNYNFDSLMPHDIVELCKDQHGCRYLQKQIEGRNLDIVRKIFEATKDHVIDLMQDPFANYLCQKMYEFCNDEQRTVLVGQAAPAMVRIALNQHGTRALQKMIEYVSTAEQINIIIEALRSNVVTLIQDLNGNHVIQKCLNHLGSKDSQFIFEAVGTSCVVVGTHRHGCCVLQRCIDHASGEQRIALIGAITANAFSLVQDPFGNYVVQYILDLQEEQFTIPMCQAFRGSVPMLSRQKFSSNVVEKCIRVSNADTKRALIEELLIPGELEKLIRDSYANYVVQTSLDYADAPTKIRLVEAIRPMLNSIRTTPYGRRIMSKIQDFDGRMSTNSSGQITPIASAGPGQITFPGQIGATPQQSPYSNASNGYGPNLASPQPHRMSNPQIPNNIQASVQQPNLNSSNQNGTNVNGANMNGANLNGGGMNGGSFPPYRGHGGPGGPSNHPNGNFF